MLSQNLLGQNLLRQRAATTLAPSAAALTLSAYAAVGSVTDVVFSLV